MEVREKETGRYFCLCRQREGAEAIPLFVVRVNVKYQSWCTISTSTSIAEEATATTKKKLGWKELLSKVQYVIRSFVVE